MAKNDFMNAMIKADLPKSMYSQDEKIKKEIIVLELLKKFIPPLASEEKAQLEQNILQFGCKDPLILWETKRGITDPLTQFPEEIAYVLLDGHNRYEICQKYNLDFRINLIEIETLEKAQDFMIDHQLGRRNLSVEQMAYLRGMKYLALRQERGKYERLEHSGQNDHYAENTEKNDTQNHSGHFDHYGKSEKLSEQLAKEFNVGEKTIRRDAEFAKGLERLPTDIKNEVLQGKSNLKKSDIIELGKIKDVETINQEVESLLSKSSNPKTPNKNQESLKKEKVVAMLKSFIQTPEDCDNLISEIKNLKKGLLKPLVA